MIRSGQSMTISIHDIMVGDVLHLEPGDSIPADGVLISGHGVKCDESSATGESDQMKKTNAREAWQQIMEGRATKNLDPFLISGSNVLEGVGTYMVTSVGPYSTYGRIMLSLQTSEDPTPLQVKLGRLADWIGYLGSAYVRSLLLGTPFIRNQPLTKRVQCCHHSVLHSFVPIYWRASQSSQYEPCREGKGVCGYFDRCCDCHCGGHSW